MIPPAWEDMWVCTDPQGHIQAIGTDSAGRLASALGDLGKDRDFGDLATRDHAEKAVVKLLARHA